MWRAASKCGFKSRFTQATITQLGFRIHIGIVLNLWRPFNAALGVEVSGSSRPGLCLVGSLEATFLVSSVCFVFSVGLL